MPTLSTGRYFVSILDIFIYFERHKFISVFCVNDKMNKHTIGIISVVRRKTIYEYHRINKMKTDIKSGVAIWFRAQKTCNVQKSCNQCVKQPKVIYMKRNEYLEMVSNQTFIVPRNLETGIIDVCGFSAIGAKNWVDAVTEWTD